MGRNTVEEGKMKCFFKGARRKNGNVEEREEDRGR
jgi:hypothetical protein